MAIIGEKRFREIAWRLDAEDGVPITREELWDLLETITELRKVVMDLHPLFHPDCEVCRKVDRVLGGG